jgi:hypothetical protein
VLSLTEQGLVIIGDIKSNEIIKLVHIILLYPISHIFILGGMIRIS